MEANQWKLLLMLHSKQTLNKHFKVHSKLTLKKKHTEIIMIKIDIINPYALTVLLSTIEFNIKFIYSVYY